VDARGVDRWTIMGFVAIIIAYRLRRRNAENRVAGELGTVFFLLLFYFGEF
jgi:hypothetical protein